MKDREIRFIVDTIRYANERRHEEIELLERYLGEFLIPSPNELEDYLWNLSYEITESEIIVSKLENKLKGDR